MDPTPAVALNLASPSQTDLREPADERREHTPNTRLHGRQLLAARVAWAGAAGILVGIYLLLLPVCLAQLQTVCDGAHCGLEQPTSESEHALAQLGLSVGGYAAVTFTLIILSSLICFAVAGVIVWRKSDDWMALLLALAGVAQGTQFVPYILETGNSAWQLLALIVNSLLWVVVFLVFALFPNGRFVPRWMPWLVIIGS